MALEVGTRLGQYEILAAIGRGGMGEVYQARDSTLGREVAIKILSDALPRSSDRLARFEREARLLAALNHPNIATLHGLEESDSIHFLVMELVEGETLAERIARGPIPMDEALRLFQQIAEAVRAAHGKGVIHRDLKPANIKLTAEGHAKVLDFGLAKAQAADRVGRAQSESPTITREGTETGVILGTAAYMSPEQARRKDLDERTDIWSFGCVSYEALTGKPAFLGDTVSDTLARVLEREPDWSVLPRETPEAVRRLLRRCLVKDPSRRMHHIADASIELDDALQESPEANGPSDRSNFVRIALWSVLAAVVSGLAVWKLTRSGASSRPVARLAVPVVAGTPDVAISPDGTQIVYRSGGGLVRRRLDESEAEAIPGTENAVQPFFSPDDQWLGFGARRRLYKMQLPVSVPTALSEFDEFQGASWASDGTIVYAPSSVSGLWRIPADGGDAEELTRPDRSRGEKSHRLPHFLPGGKALLFTAGTTTIASFDDARIEYLELDTGARRVLIDGGAGGVYVRSGHIVYRRQRTLFAVSFDLERVAVTGSPVPVVSDVRPAFNGRRAFAVSDEGTLVYTPGGANHFNFRLVLVDRQGKARALTEFDQVYREPRFSPDGGHLAVGITAANEQLYRYDIERGTLIQLTFAWDNYAPTWTADGEHLIFTKSPDLNLFQVAADGSGEEQRLTTSENPHYPFSATADGRYLAFEEVGTGGDVDLWVLPLNDDGEPVPFLQTPARELYPRFSPDGRFIAYTSDETGRQEVYLLSFPDATRKTRVSIDGGFHPVWARSGKELFYRIRLSGTRSRMMVVEVSGDTPPRLSRPRALFEDDYDSFGNWSYDVSPDDQRFVMIEMDREARSVTHFNVVLNWFQELERLAP